MMLDDEQLKVLKTMFALGGISALAAACRTILSKEERTLAGFLTRFILGTFAGMVAGFVASDQGFSEEATYAIVAASAVTARELLQAVVVVAETLRDHSARITRKVIDKKLGDKDGQP